VSDNREPGAGPPLARRSARAQPAGSFPIVAIGASAGGLEACGKLLDVLPPTSGMAFVLIQHLDPTHDSMLVELLSRHTEMPVRQAADGMAVQPDHLYVIPPGTYLSIRADTLLLSQPNARHGAWLPFDYLLNSLAADAGPRTACVVLSGTGGDGSLGLQSVHNAKGLVIAQALAEAAFNGMPSSAVETGMVDHVLAIADMPRALAQFASSRATATEGDIESDQRAGDWLTAIIELLLAQTPHDFRLYKKGTLRRRIERRMGMAGIKATRLDLYHAMLTADAAERDLLAKDLLINVTSFFRDPKVFAALAAETIPALLHDHVTDRPIRIWVPGCSTGEEAYSLAILFQEQLTAATRHIKLTIFASDIDTDAIVAAREGLYPATITADVSPERLARFFIKEDLGYRVIPELRASVIFTPHDVLTDPPFSRLDMVSCRNLLIYLRPEAQAKVISLFHFALRGGGLLLLGGSETIGNADGRFEILSKTARLYRQIGRDRQQDYGFVAATGGTGRVIAGVGRGQQPVRQAALAELCHRLILEEYAPAAVLINDKNECLFSLGPTDRYLRIAPGQPTFDLPAMARQETRTKLRSAIQQATQRGTRVEVTGGRTTHLGTLLAFRIVVQPVVSDNERLLLICFVDEPVRPPVAAGLPSEQEQSRVAELELETTHAELQGAIHNLEIAHQEQKGIAEETMSANEEFQSTNEELMTSKEELQSLNEELTALNSQLQETLERQRTTANDLQNVLYSTDVATLFLDSALSIRLFTPAVRRVFNVISGDIGRPLADLRPVVADPALLGDARTVLRTQTAIECEIEGAGDVWFSRRIMPYRTADTGTEGVVITFADITERKRVTLALEVAKRQAEQATRAKTRFLAAASHDLRQPLQTLTLLQGLLAKAVQGDVGRKLVARLDTTLGTMSNMLNALLDVNQIEAGIVTPEITTFPIEDLLRRLHSEFLYQAQAKGLELRAVHCSLMVTTDAALLEQMVRNLLSNALKYTKRGKVLLGCRRRGDKALIEVWDTGSGIPSGSLQTIFEEYRQLDTDLSSRQGGLGLGLSIVRHLGHLLDHPVTVRSRPGRGSVFAIAVNATSGTGATPYDVPPLESARPGAVEPRARILLVEDDADLRDLLEISLIDQRHAVMQAADSAAALELINDSQAPPDLILADFNLPGGMNGLLLTAELRRRFKREIPAIILTGDISADTLRDVAGASCTRLTKPVRLSDLTDTIRLLLALPPAVVSNGAVQRPAPGAGAPGMIYLVDDDRQICVDIRDVFQADGIVVQAYPSAEAFLNAYRPGHAACLLVDAHLPGMSGLDLLRRMQAKADPLPSIMITGHGDLPLAVLAMRAGALDFIVKPVGYNELRIAVNQALDRARDADKQLAWRTDATKHLAGLTPRQHEIMHLVLAGQPSKNIAADLGISQRTVENHRAAIMHKTGATSLPALARLALAAAAPETTASAVAAPAPTVPAGGLRPIRPPG